MKRVLMITALLAPGIVCVGCATTPSASTTQTFNQIALSVGTVADTAVKTTDALLNAKTISSTQASAVKAITDKVEAAIAVANTAYVAGNLPTANAKIAAASAAVIAAQACLAEPSAQLIACIAGIPAP